jgi:hypothetical protein
MLPRCPGPTSRREFLGLGALSLGGLALSDVMRARAATGRAAPDTSVILFYCNGGPSQFETYDLKPNAPSGIRSVFAPIRTNVPGIDICELFPLQARRADRFTLIRSLNHNVPIHSDGGIVVLTGKVPSKLDPTSQSKSEHPDFGMVASKVLGWQADGLPRYVGVPQPPYMTRPNYLGVSHAAFAVNDPQVPPPQLRLARGPDARFLDDRRGMLRELDQLRWGHDRFGGPRGADRFWEQAFQLLTSPAVAQAFDINREDPRLRDRYGRNLWGQACLLARRLAEAGTSVISIDANVPESGPTFTNWDDHAGNAGRPGHFAEYMKVRLPYMDRALAALIDDIYERGLDRKILLVVVGEFGRTPRITTGPPNQSVGRDHWPQAYSALISGGGFRMGQVIGATNSRGEHPIERPLTPQDLLATIYQHLGVDPRYEFTDSQGRPLPILYEGNVIGELV